jgi:hypothetical protein
MGTMLGAVVERNPVGPLGGSLRGRNYCARQLLYFAGADGTTVETSATLRFTEANGSAGAVGGAATTVDGIISTRTGSAGSWTAMIGKTPFGQWSLALPNTDRVRSLFQNQALDDVLLVLTYGARTEAWPT